MLEFQRKLLGDGVRNRAFGLALKHAIAPGCSVSDVGSGTGYLSFVARSLGARSCHLYEVDPAAMDMSRKIAREGGIRDFHFHPGFSTDHRKPVRTDVVVSETLGNYALEERILETLNDAARFLKPQGTLIPQGLEQWVAPVVTARLHQQLNVWDQLKPHPGVSFAPAQRACFNNIYVKTVTPQDLWAAPDASRRWDQVDFRVQNSSVRQATVRWTVDAPLAVWGMCLWWVCQLLADICISTSPHAAPTHWEQIYLPVFEPIQLRTADVLELKIQHDSRLERELRVQWKLRALRGAQQVVSESHDTYLGQG